MRTTETIVPLSDAVEVGDELRLPYDRARFDEAPDIDPDVELTEEQERVLYEHYGREWNVRSGEETDVAMTRSEEEVTVGRRRSSGPSACGSRRCWVEDEVTETVPVRREVIRLETDPPPEGNIESVEDVDEDPRS